ncbi:hypothetical protein BCR39DRAFT_559462 [Naematelia encephala]|uniref:3'-5' exonuclease domain-containing protein n=1 Tax=Naematelia encephala TaxID=71784 RepID=A0A1Y2B1D2_9TREE|nr:hypothetical protein BCR39DRAFT_559462 [Naematelia encephala]
MASRCDTLDPPRTRSSTAFQPSKFHGGKIGFWTTIATSDRDSVSIIEGSQVLVISPTPLSSSPKGTTNTILPKRLSRALRQPALVSPSTPPLTHTANKNIESHPRVQVVVGQTTRVPYKGSDLPGVSFKAAPLLAPSSSSPTKQRSISFGEALHSDKSHQATGNYTPPLRVVEGLVPLKSSRPVYPRKKSIETRFKHRPTPFAPQRPRLPQPKRPFAFANRPTPPHLRGTTTPTPTAPAPNSQTPPHLRRTTAPAPDRPTLPHSRRRPSPIAPAPSTLPHLQSNRPTGVPHLPPPKYTPHSQPYLRKGSTVPASTVPVSPFRAARLARPSRSQGPSSPRPLLPSIRTQIHFALKYAHINLSILNKMSKRTELIPDPVKDFAKYLPHLTHSLDEVTTAAASLPGKSDLDFHRTMDRGFAKSIDEQSQRVLRMTERLLNLVIPESTKAKGLRRGLQDEDDVLDTYRRGVIEVTDGLLEDADHSLDELNGLKKASAIQVDPAAVAASSSKLPGPGDIRTKDGSYLPRDLWHASHLSKPQLSFPDVVSNSVELPQWTPSLTTKDFARVPLDHIPELKYELTTAEREDEALARRRHARELLLAQHPYYHETRHLEYPTHMFELNPPVHPESFEDTPFDFVDTPGKLDEMVQVLQGAKEIAVDLEHHAMRSYHGFTCLIQISVRGRDWVVDALKLRGELREGKLGGVMANPNIVKVFHGAKSDIAWLQRDFDIYVVNLFDTYHASVVLDLQSRSLASLLTTYASFNADKRYQMADWRLRPLPAEMLKYARADTHFLLYIYDTLRNTLLERDASTESLHQVLRESADTALTPYVRDQPDEVAMERSMKTWLSVSSSGLPGQVWRALWQWRDRTARELDESPSWILTNDMMKRLSLPSGAKSLIAIRALLKRSPIATSMAGEILKVIQDAKTATPPPEPVKHIQPDSELVVEQGLPSQMDKEEPISTTVERDSSIEVTSTTSKSASSLLATEAQATYTTVLSTPPSFAEETASTSTPNKRDIWERVVQRPVPRVKSKMFGSTIKSSSSAATSVKPKGSSKLFGKSLARLNRPIATGFDSVKAEIVADLAPVPKAPVQPVEIVVNKKKEKAVPAVESVPFIPVQDRTTIVEKSSTSSTQAGLSKPSNSSKAPLNAVPVEREVVQVKRKRNKKRALVSPVDNSIPISVSATATSPVHVDSSTPAIDPSSATTTRVNKKPKKETAKKETKQIPAFDYKDVPNLLDNPGSAAGGKGRKRRDKKPKPAGITEDKFGKVPKDRSAPKEGARSGTFV